MKRKVTVKISKFILLVVAVLIVAIIAKLSYVVLSPSVDGINLHDKAQSIATVTKTLYADRGSIYDCFGEELASTVNSYTVIAYLNSNKTNVTDKEGTADALAPILNMSEEKIIELLSKDNYQVELRPGGYQISEVVKSKIEALELDGIDFIKNSKKRYYNKSSFASYLIGYAKDDGNGTIVGELGIEKYYNDILSGTNGYTKYLKYTSSNYKIPNTNEDTVDAKNGNDIYLTIDSSIELIAEKAVSKMQEDFNSDWAIFMVMDANTGAIVASSTSPNFNPNDTNTIKEYMNPSISYQYEPGSVMKIFSFASAIEEGLYDGEETFVSGSITLKDKTVIRDSERQGWGTISFDEGFARSSNVAATTLALRLGVEKLYSYYDALGFGKKTGIELSNEAVGDIEMVYESELATASFGQGVSVTAIQMLEALSSITNNGEVIKPYIVSKIVDEDNNIVYEGKREVVKKVYSESTVKKMQELMKKVVEINKYWQMDNVSLMGKTGTAQIASPSGGYLTGTYDYVKSFAGIFPSDDPKYIVYVAAKKPEVNLSSWAKVITTAIDEIASYAKLTEKSEEQIEAKSITLDNYISKEVNSLDIDKAKIILIGDGDYIINQYPLKNKVLLEGEKLFLLTNGDYYLEDLTGWSISDVKTYTSLLGINLDYTGYGYVDSQSIEEGTLITDNMTLSITLK